MTVGSTKLKRWYLIVSRTHESSRQLVWAIVLSLGMLLSACSWVPKGASQLDVGIEDRGVASWYGGSFHGKQAANGELFDMEGIDRGPSYPPARQRSPGRESREREISPCSDHRPGSLCQQSDSGSFRGAAARLGMMEGGLSHVRVQLVGERRPEALLSSEAMKTVSVALILGPEQAP